MKRSVRLIIILALILTMNLPAHAAHVSVFSDVKSSDWYYAAVEYAVDNSLFNGTSDSTFSPDASMTRGMFVTVLGRFAEVPDSYGRTKTTPFADVTQADYFFPYAAWADDQGIVSGIGGNRFDPNGEISREQIAAMLYRYAEQISSPIYHSEKYDAFADTGSVSGYAVTALQWATSNGIVNGANGKLSPQDKASRAQVAQIFQNFSQLDATEAPAEQEEPEEPTAENPVDWENYHPTYAIPTGKSATDADGGYYDYDLATEIMEQVNTLRVDNGANTLSYHPKIQEWASVRAKEQTISKSHTRPDGSACLTVGSGLESENLAWITNYTVEQMSVREYAENVVAWWNNSESHKLGMIKPSANLGAVSCYVRGESVYIVHLFSAKTMYFMDYLL